jgi:hypothetical protein
MSRTGLELNCGKGTSFNVADKTLGKLVVLAEMILGKIMMIITIIIIIIYLYIYKSETGWLTLYLPLCACC